MWVGCIEMVGSGQTLIDDKVQKLDQKSGNVNKTQLHTPTCPFVQCLFIKIYSKSSDFVCEMQETDTHVPS